MKRNLFFIVCFFIWGGAIAEASGNIDIMFIEHRVEKGQTEYFLEKKYNVPFKNILHMKNGSVSVSGGRHDIRDMDILGHHQILQEGDSVIIPILSTIHKVMTGDTLYSIATTYGVTVEQVIRFNPKAASVLRPGMNLRIPGFGFAHKVMKTETFTGIARLYNLKPALLIHYNKAKQSAVLRENQMVYIPVNPLKHFVRKSETVYSICRSYGISVHELKKRNPQLLNKKVIAGEWISIPF